MTVKELIVKLLATVKANPEMEHAKVMVTGYEGGLDDLNKFEIMEVALNYKSSAGDGKSR